MKQNINVTCPECKGSKGAYETDQLEPPHNGGQQTVTYFKICWFCAGTGFATDEDTYQEFWRES